MARVDGNINIAAAYGAGISEIDQFGLKDVQAVPSESGDKDVFTMSDRSGQAKAPGEISLVQNKDRGPVVASLHDLGVS